MKNRRSRPFKRSNNRNNDNFTNGNNNTRVRGNLSTVLEKYKVLAKDAAASGDYVGAENYMQHAEHYSRLLSERQVRYNDKNDAIKANGKDIATPDEVTETLDPAKAIEEANS